MSDFIFIHERVTKVNLYTRLKQIMIDAGWQNISSKPSTDYDVMFSTGETGDKRMVINLKEFDGTSTGSAISNSSERRLDIGLPKSYTPGDPGMPGTFGRTVTWNVHLVIYGLCTKEADLDIYYHCNKNRLIFVIECPPSHVPNNANTSSILFMGISDNTVGFEYPDSGPIVASTMAEFSAIRATDDPTTVRTDQYALTKYINKPSNSNISMNRTVFLEEVAYGSDNESVRGYIDGIYLINSATPLELSDVLTLPNGNEYRVFQLASIPSGWASFTEASGLFAIRVR